MPRPSHLHAPCDSAGRKRPVPRQHAAHRLRVGGHPRSEWMASAGISGEAPKLPLKPAPRCACGRGRVYGGCPVWRALQAVDKKMARGLDKNSEDLTRTPQLVANHRCLAR